MSLTEHLGVEIAEYDDAIRTYIPRYEELIATAASSLRLLEASSPTIVDLGTGTGALAERCLRVHPAARLIGLDADDTMLEAARVRLADWPRVDLVRTNFLDAPLPACDAIVASLALHHIPDEDTKRGFYASCRDALRPGGLLVSADCFPAREPRLAAAQRDAWSAHLRRTYSPERAAEYFATWAREDVYCTLEDEFEWLAAAGLTPEIVWRDGSFAVVAAFA